MGQNGAGKSTLIKLLTGVYPPDAGRIELQQRPVLPASPLAAQQLGIATVYQEVNLCPNLTVTENILAGRLPRRWGSIAWGAAHRQADGVLRSLNTPIDGRQLLGDQPVAVQQMIAIARAVSMAAQVLVLDEPTSSLDENETAQIFAVMKRLRDRGVAILFITHFLDQAYAMADRITVMRNGSFVGEYRPGELPRLKLVSLMIGRDFSEADATPPEPLEGVEDQIPVLRARGLARRGQLHPLDLDVQAGQVLGLAGLLGSGRSETARLLFGADRADGGSLNVAGQARRFGSPRDAMRAGLGYCPEERKTEGIVAELSVRENIALALQVRRGWWRYLRHAQQQALAEHWVRELDIKTAGVDGAIGQLSGGNQQKAMLARWLATEPRLLILDEPTRGIDVAAKQEIMDLVLALCRRGLALVFISSEMPEVLRVSHRIAVMRDRRKVAELPNAQLTEADIFRVITASQGEPRQKEAA
jgi:simple sugar transport system ATP-binding protein